MVCAHCHAESDADFDFCPQCGQRSEPLLLDRANASDAPTISTKRRPTQFSIAVSLLTLLSYLLIPYISLPSTTIGTSIQPPFSIDGWQMNWLDSWEFWPTAARWICLSLIVLFLVAVFQWVLRSNIALFVTQLAVSAYLVAAMIRLFATVPSAYFGDLINPWIVLLGALSLIVLAGVGLVERLGHGKSLSQRRPAS